MNYAFGNCTQENEIITLLHSGNKKALATIFSRHQLPLRYFVKQCLKGLPDFRQITEDIVADSFIRLWERRADINTFEEIKSFLYEAVKNGCITQLQQAGGSYTWNEEIGCHPETLEIIAKILSGSGIIKAELIYRIWQDIEQLPPIRRRIFKMSYFEDLNIFEIARILQISVDTVRVQKSLALDSLRTIFKEGSQ